MSSNRLLIVTACLNKFFNHCEVVLSDQIFGISTSEEIIKTESHISKIVQKQSFSRPKDKFLNALQYFMHTNGS